MEPNLVENLQELASRIEQQCNMIKTEEGTKVSFIMPFLQILGYQVFNPAEVEPEFTADVGTKKGEKVDYAIKKDGNIIMLLEAKACGSPLDIKHASQLYRYFGVTDARIAILTNGVDYQFYTDLDKANRMDEKPFMEFNLLELDRPLLQHVKKLTKDQFDLDSVLHTAKDLKHTKGIQRTIEEEFNAPSEELVKYLISKSDIYSGRMTPSVKEDFSKLVKNAINQYINERIQTRIKIALSDQQEVKAPEAQSGESEAVEPQNRVATTQDEQEAFMIVKAIIREVVNPERIKSKDTISYFGILLDHTRKPICRLHFNRTQKYLGLFDEKRVEHRIPIDKVDDIFNHKDAMLKTVALYESGGIPEDFPIEDAPERSGASTSEFVEETRTAPAESEM